MYCRFWIRMKERTMLAWGVVGGDGRSGLWMRLGERCANRWPLPGSLGQLYRLYGIFRKGFSALERLPVIE